MVCLNGGKKYNVTMAKTDARRLAHVRLYHYLASVYPTTSLHLKVAKLH